ncbi:MAG: CRTAC1 family protein [Rhodobacter sp.]|nr:CRTAC1 family protein [Rhodobacter sp.]
MKTLLLICLIPGMAMAGPQFQDRAAHLPEPHVYGGGWEHFVGGGTAVFDCNGDALPEIFAAGGENPAHLFVNTSPRGGDLEFAPGELPVITGVTGAYPLDIDSDGLLDLAVLRVGPNMLLRGLGNCRFKDATADWGFTQADQWSTAFSATWEPGQAWPTLAIGNYVDRADPDGPFEACDHNLIYRAGADGYTTPLRLDPGFCALSMLFSDFSRRGRADLRISNDRHYYVRGGYEQMWRPEQGRFLDETDGWARVSIWGMGIASADLNRDSTPDVMLTSMGDQLLQFSSPEGLQNAPYTAGATAHRPYLGDDGRPSTGWHAAFGDVDNDGLADIFIAKGNVDQMPGSAMEDPNNLLIGQPDGTFAEAADSAGIATLERARGAALADLNGDGRLDLVVVNRRAPMELWQNVSAAGNYAVIELEQPAPNRRAVGAWVELRDRNGVRTLERTVGGGHVSGTAAPLHFGLGELDSAEARVIWPDGDVSDWTPVAVNGLTTLSR